VPNQQNEVGARERHTAATVLSVEVDAQTRGVIVEKV